MLKWVFGADTGPYRTALNKMREDTKAFSGSVTTQLAGVFAGGAIIAGAKNIISHFARVQDIADRFGESAVSIQAVGAAANLAGSDIEGVAKSMTAATRNAVDAANGNDELSESFARMGINAAEFANLPMEDKLLALAKGYQESGSQAEGLADVMKIAGKNGSEMIPLLSGDLGELKTQLKDGTYASESLVASMAKMDDMMASVSQVGTVLGAKVIGLLIAGFKSFGVIAMTSMDSIVKGFFVLVDAASEAGSAVTKALTGDLAGAKKSAEKIGSIVAAGIKDGYTRSASSIKFIGDIFNESMSDGEVTRKKPQVIAEQDDGEALKKREKAIEEIAKLEEDARQRALTLAEKILDAEKQRAELWADSEFSSSDEKRLEAKKGMLEVEKQIRDMRNQQEKERQTAIDLSSQKAAAVKDAMNAEASAKRDNKYNSLDDAGKIKMLKEEQKALRDEAAKLMQDGSNTTIGEAYKKRAEAERKQGEINGLQNSERDRLKTLVSRGPSIATSSLAEIGGGGGAMMMEKDYARRQVDLLQIIADNTAGGSDGARPPEPNI